MYSEIWQFEPLKSSRNEALAVSAQDLSVADQGFANVLNEVSVARLSDVVEIANACISNRMEGYPVSPGHVRRGVSGEFSADEESARLEYLGLAYVTAERWALAEITHGERPDFARLVRGCHEVFYGTLPASMRFASGDGGSVIPGAWRTDNRAVGRHVAPTFESVPRFMARLSEVYARGEWAPSHELLDVAAAHHRLAWVHPFVDGNGRVGRIVAHAMLQRAGLNQHGCWSLASSLERGLGNAGPGEEYMAAMAGADVPRMGALDGRGNLSLKMFDRFCQFFLNAVTAEIMRMHEVVLSLNGSMLDGPWDLHRAEILASQVFPSACIRIP